MLERCHKRSCILTGLGTIGRTAGRHPFVLAGAALPYPAVESAFPDIGATAITVVAVLMIAFVLGYAIRRRDTRMYAELYRLEQEKQAAEGEFRATLYSMADAFLTVDAKGRVARMNSVAERLTGWTEAEGNGRPIEEVVMLFEDASGEPVSHSIVQLIHSDSTQAISRDLQIRSRDGGTCPVSASFSPVEDASGSTGKIVLVLHDRTTEREAERELVESEQRLHRTVSISPLPVMLHAEDGEILLLSDAWTDISGYTPADLPKVQAWAERAYRNGTQAVHPGSEKAYTEKVTAPTCPVAAANGESLIWDFRSAPLGHLSDGRKLAITIAVDNTERDAFEHHLADAMQEAQRSNRDLEQFAYIASHDLQEPLRMVASYTQLLSQRYGDQLDEKAHKYIEYAVDGAVRMQGLINDLLAYSRISTKGAPLEPVDSHAALGVALSRLASAIQDSRAIITNSELPMVNADPAQIAQLFQNLIGNALKYCGEKAPVIRVNAENQGDEWQFSVSDNGIGFDMKYAEKIFVIFQRLHTRQEFSGTGIGLAVCLRIVERHGGRMWVESSLGKGATFYFMLPKAQEIAG